MLDPKFVSSQNFLGPKSFLNPLFFWIQNFVWPNFFTPNFFNPKLFDPNIFWLNIYFGPEMYLGPIFLGPTNFGPIFFFDSNFFWTNMFGRKILLTKKKFKPKKLWTFFFGPNIFLNKKSLDNLFNCNKKIVKSIFFGKNQTLLVPTSFLEPTFFWRWLFLTKNYFWTKRSQNFHIFSYFQISLIYTFCLSFPEYKIWEISTEYPSNLAQYVSAV